MPLVIAELGAIMISAKYITQKKEGGVIALLSDTGMRCAEAVGLRVEDVFLSEPTPYLMLRPNEARSLKTKGSERLVPLVGAGLWAVRRAKDHAQNGFLFPRYIDFRGSPYANKATYASNTINKWLRSFPLDRKDQKSAHSFRHTVQDRLRDAQVPKEIQDAICGWQTKGMGANYGQGYSASVLAEHLQKIVHADLFPSQLPSTG